MSYKFPKSSRLKQKQAIDFVFKDAKAFKSKCLTMLVRPTENKQSKLAIIASKKKIGKAHNRVRLKRVCKESFRHWRWRMDAIQPVNIVIILSKHAKALDNHQCFNILSEQWERLENYYKS